MNADACETAARHLFGVMAPEDEPLYEAAAADDLTQHAARRRVEEVACAVALQASPSVEPPAYVLPRIKAACGIGETVSAPAQKRGMVAWAGWGIAAALAAAVLWQWPRSRKGWQETANGNPVEVVKPGRERIGATAPATGPQETAPVVADAPGVADSPKDNSLDSPGRDPAAGTDERSENRRLIQELTVLRPELERYRQRDRQLFAAVPGRSWPLIVEMRPPGSAAAIDPASSSGITSAIGELLNGKTGEPEVPAIEPETPPEDNALTPAEPVGPTGQPRAIPVYDPARDQGTLAVRDLAPAPEGSEYNLWVSTGEGRNPVLTGSLPADIRPSDSFDFSLGSTGFIPQSYYLTLDPAGSPAAPAESNIVLQGP